MTPDDLDRILSSEDLLEPSAGFTMKVMESVRQEAAEPPPLPFPWFRFAVGLTACIVMAGAGTVLLPQFETTVAAIAAPLAPLAGVAPELGYATAALVLSLGLVFLPRLVVRRQ